MESIRVFIVDDHPLMRSALEMAIEAARDMQAAGEAPTGAEALELIPLIEPDVVLMDLMMPEVTGLAAIRALMSMLPNVRILVLTSLDKERDIIEAVRAGAHGYIPKMPSEMNYWKPSAPCIAEKLIYQRRSPRS